MKHVRTVEDVMTPAVISVGPATEDVVVRAARTVPGVGGVKADSTAPVCA
ncbi:hypothetical protein ACFXJO_26150 [Streptomyces lavendulae]